MAEFASALQGGQFLVTAELHPPLGTDLEPLVGLASQLAQRLSAVVLSDNAGAISRMSPIMAAHKLIKHSGAQVIMTLTCRDRNRLALGSDMLAAAAAGVENLLVVSGDFVTLGDQPGAKPVYDLDSVQAMLLATELMAGGQGDPPKLQGAPSFLLGGAVPHAADPLGPALIKFHKKLQAGAKFFITTPVKDPAKLDAFLDRVAEAQTSILAWVEASADEMEAAAELVGQIKSQGKAAGVHLSVSDDQAALPKLLDLAGL